MPPVNTGQVSNHLAPGLMAIIGANLGGRESFYSTLCNVGTSERNYEDILAATGLPVAVEKQQGTDIQSFDILEGTTKRLTHKVFAIGGEVTFEAWEDDLYKGKGSAIRQLADGISDSLAERVELEAHAPFILGFTSGQYTVLPSGLNWFNTAHTPVTGAQGPTQQNRPSTDSDLTLTALRTAFTTMRKYKNDQGLRIPGFAKPAQLIVSPDFEYTAKELLGSQYRPDASPGSTSGPNNMLPNVTQNAVSLLVDPYMTAGTTSGSADAWYVKCARHNLEFLWRKRPFFDSFDERRSRTAVFIGGERFSVNPIHYLGYYGSVGA